jgi:hypothetical protein
VSEQLAVIFASLYAFDFLPYVLFSLANGFSGDNLWPFHG